MTDKNRQIAVLMAANHIAHTLSKANAFEDALDDLMRTFIDLVAASEGSIQLLRPSSEQTRRTLVRLGGDGERLFEHRLDDLLTGWVVKHRQSLLTTDIFASFNLGNNTGPYKNIGSAIAAPLIAGDQIIGVANLLRDRDQKPFSHDDRESISELSNKIIVFIEQAQFREQLFQENERLKQASSDIPGHNGFIGKSQAIREIFSLLERVMPTDGRVLIQGESGTGKERIARMIHTGGPRKDAPFVGLDCGALPANLLESELFGYVRGAFTGASEDRRGLFEAAGGGTLFLDEIANMSLETQAKLLRVLQEEEVRPLGSNMPRKIDVRVIAASSGNLKKMVSEGMFRPDLFYRLNVIPIRLPALRERKEDIPLLATYFLTKYAERHRREIQSITSETIILMEQYAWPGNVRELENVVERAVILAGDSDRSLLPIHLPSELNQHFNRQHTFRIPLSGDLTALLNDYEGEILHAVLKNHNWNQSAAAAALCISERVIRYKMKRLGIVPPR